MRLPHISRRPDASLEPQRWVDSDEERSAADRLAAYSAESLSPDEAALSRLGASVRAAFVESATRRDAAAVAGVRAEGGMSALGRPWSLSRRRVFAAVCAVAILTLSSVGFTAAESGPGQPFYRLKLNIEAVNLPPPSSLDRLNADLSRADARLDDIAGSAAASNWNGAADAAAAYLDVISTIALPPDPSQTAAARDRLDGHLARLEKLRGTSRTPETAALDKAIAAVCKVLGIPVPTPPPAPADPKPQASNHADTSGSDTPGASSTPHGDAGRSGSGDPRTSRDLDDSGGPGAGPGRGSSGSGSSDSPGGSGGNHASPTPKSSSSAGAFSGRSWHSPIGRDALGGHIAAKAGAHANAGHRRYRVTD